MQEEKGSVFCVQMPDIWHDLVDFIYPRLCYVCDDVLPRGSVLKCPDCEQALVTTDMHKYEDNEMMHRMAGRLSLRFGAAMYRFYKGSKVQNMIHRWKYHNFPEIGTYLGLEYGKLLTQVEALQDLTAIIPVPLHRSRFKWRGYNQAETFARGLSEVMRVKVDTRTVVRPRKSASQTTKDRRARLEDLENSFELSRQPGHQAGALHYLLVDDLLTTGATMESFARAVLEIPGVCISLVTVAIGQK